MRIDQQQRVMAAVFEGAMAIPFEPEGSAVFYGLRRSGVAYRQLCRKTPEADSD